MSISPIKRKLVAILAADAFGYSRLMAADEEATMKLLAAHRAIIDGIIEFHEGRIVNTAGDSVLAEFVSPVQAVRCAVEIQDALRTRNDALPEDRRLQFRIGINLGDVMVKGDDLLGDGVNVAARLESIAEPGGICISSSVYDQIAGKLDLGFVDVGAQSLKNIDRPVRVYRIDRDGHGRSAKHRRPEAKRLMGLAAAVVLALAAWHFGLVPLQEAAQRARAEAARRAAEEERQHQEALARAAAEAARQRAEAEKQRAESEAARRRTEAELAKERAIAESAKRRADAQAAAAIEAKRALVARQAAEDRARTSAELARLRAEAEEAKRTAADLAAAARRSAEASSSTSATASASAIATVPSLREGQWNAEISCPPYKRFPPRTIKAPISVADDAFVVQERENGEPGSLNLRGVLNSDGTLHFRGAGVSGRRAGSRQYLAGFAAKPVGTRYEGSGRLGVRECQLVLSRAP